jgi:hypothetical protein
MFHCTFRGKIPIKGKGELPTYVLITRKEQASAP